MNGKGDLMEKRSSPRRHRPEMHSTTWPACMVKDKFPTFQCHPNSLSHVMLLSNAKDAGGLSKGCHLVWMHTATVGSLNQARHLCASIMAKRLLFRTEGIQTTICLSTQNSTHKLSGSVLDSKCLLLRVDVWTHGCVQTSEDEKTHEIHEQGRGQNI